MQAKKIECMFILHKFKYDTRPVSPSRGPRGRAQTAKRNILIHFHVQFQLFSVHVNAFQI